MHAHRFAHPQLLGLLNIKQAAGTVTTQSWAGLNAKVHLPHKATPSRLAVSSNAKNPTQRVKQNEETKEHVPSEKSHGDGAGVSIFVFLQSLSTHIFWGEISEATEIPFQQQVTQR